MPYASIQRLHELLAYNEITGDLCWRIDRRGGPGSQPIPAGSIAGTVAKNGYRYVNVDKTPQLAHRIAWALTYGRWPKDQIDHINMHRLDNRLSNLREATNAENNRNRRHQSNNKTKIKGVTATGSGYFSRICTDGKIVYLGHFRTKEEASAAYETASELQHKSFRRTR